MVSPAVFDTLAALALLAIAVAGAYTPAALSKLGKREGVVTSRSLAFVLGNMLSAGVMISAGFVHLLGAAVQDLRPGGVFPLAPFLCGLGFILTLIADFVGQRLASRSNLELVHCHSLPPTESTAPAAGHDDDTLQRVVVSEAANHATGNGGSPAAEEESPLRARRSQHSFQLEVGATGNGARSPDSPKGGGAFEQAKPAPIRAVDSDVEPLFGAAQVSSTADIEGTPVAPIAVSMHHVSFITAVLMAMALCFHSILEGMAMGAQETIVDSLHVFIAIFAHKGLAAYALGSSVVDSGASQRRFWTIVAAFALATPLGILLGRIVAGESDGDVAAGLSALASGTFLYVAFMEVIPKELKDPEHGFSKLAMLCLGFGAMSLLAIWA